MERAGTTERGGVDGATIARVAVGLVWLAGAAFNALVTLRPNIGYAALYPLATIAKIVLAQVLLALLL